MTRIKNSIHTWTDRAIHGTGNYMEWLELEAYPYNRVTVSPEHWLEQEEIDALLCQQISERFLFGAWKSLCERLESHGNATDNDAEVQGLAGREREPD